MFVKCSYPHITNECGKKVNNSFQHTGPLLALCIPRKRLRHIKTFVADTNEERAKIKLNLIERRRSGASLQKS